MSDRLKNNLIAALVVIGFWLIIVIPTIVQAADPIVTDSTQKIISSGTQNTKVESPPPSAIAPQMTSGTSNFLCTISASAAVQTQILGLSIGGFHTEENCLLLSKAQALHNFGMKIASISLLCQDPAIFKSMADAGSYCPYEGLLGEDAKAAWAAHTDKIPTELNEPNEEDITTNYLKIFAGVASAFLFF